MIVESNPSFKALTILRWTLQYTSQNPHLHRSYRSISSNPNIATPQSHSHHQNRRYSTPPKATLHDPLQITIPTNEYAQPLSPLPLSIPSIPSTKTPLTREAFVRLHRLSALNPPVEGSDEEKEMIEGLEELIGLMDLVKEVDLELDGDVGSLLGEGVGEIVVSEETVGDSTTEIDKDGKKVFLSRWEGGDGGSERDGEDVVKEKTGRELLEYATRRIGDYYAYKPTKRNA